MCRRSHREWCWATVVKILDFGLVKSLADVDPRLTMTGEGIGNKLPRAPCSEPSA
ncbi:hypothetical protein [Streptomyces sp. NPDC048496]|uniref:hypothetical protein n=1 Tax=Streptomyces sp. NPDC048496 TaxID=3365558 RepID=UPI003721255B